MKIGRELKPCFQESCQFEKMDTFWMELFYDTSVIRRPPQSVWFLFIALPFAVVDPSVVLSVMASIQVVYTFIRASHL